MTNSEKQILFTAMQNADNEFCAIFTRDSKIAISSKQAHEIHCRMNTLENLLHEFKLYNEFIEWNSSKH